MSTITTRSGKGAPLTNNEVDSNFTNLNTDKAELSGATFTGDVKLGDNDKATFGAGSDLQIFHNGTESFIREVGEGGLKIDSNGPEITLRVNATENALMAESNGAVTVYYNNVAKLATTATGIDVTGTATMDGLVVETGGTAIEFNHSATGPTLRFNNTDQTVADGQQLARMEFSTDDAGITTDVAYLQLTGNGTGGAAFFDIMTGSGALTKTARFADNGDISFYEDTGTTAKLFWDASAESLGIGTSSPSAFLHLAGTNVNIALEPTGTNAYFDNRKIGGATKFRVSNVSTNDTTAMTLTSVGNVLVGTADDVVWNNSANSAADNGHNLRSDGRAGFAYYNATANANATVNINRTGSDGDLIRLFKSGTAVGSIGTKSGALLLESATCGLWLNGSSDLLIATDGSGAGTNGAMDLGSSGNRFKDLYLSGTATMDGLTVNTTNGVSVFESTGISSVGLQFKTNGTNRYQLQIPNASADLAFLAGGTTKALNLAANGDISFYEDTGTTAKLVWDASAESLGIGGAPSEQLEVSKWIKTGSGAFNNGGIIFPYLNGNTSSRSYVFTNDKNTYGDFALLVSDTASSDPKVGSTVLTVKDKKLGIGTTSPNTLMEIASTTPILRITNTTNASWSAGDDIGRLSFYSNDSSAVGPHETAFILNESDFGSNITQLSGALSFGTAAYNAAATERMRIDSAGNLLVGKTSGPNYNTVGVDLTYLGEVQATVDSNPCITLNRQSSDGNIAVFRKDGEPVGNIGSASGVVSYIVLDPRTGVKGAGLLGSSADANTGILQPTDNSGSPADAAIQLGTASTRFKDLYLSGGVYLGGTAAANKLDDYEEGTFTPTYGGSSSDPTATYVNQRGNYTKVGNTVCFTLEVRTSAISGGSGSLFVEGLPFTANARHFECALTMYYVTFDAAYSYTAEIPPNANHMLIRGSRSGNSDSSLDVSNVLNVNPSLIRITGTYQTA